MRGCTDSQWSLSGTRGTRGSLVLSSATLHRCIIYRDTGSQGAVRCFRGGIMGSHGGL